MYLHEISRFTIKPSFVFGLGPVLVLSDQFLVHHSGRRFTFCSTPESNWSVQFKNCPHEDWKVEVFREGL